MAASINIRNVSKRTDRQVGNYRGYNCEAKRCVKECERMVDGREITLVAGNGLHSIDTPILYGT